MFWLFVKEKLEITHWSSISVTLFPKLQSRWEKW